MNLLLTACAAWALAADPLIQLEPIAVDLVPGPPALAVEVVRVADVVAARVCPVHRVIARIGITVDVHAGDGGDETVTLSTFAPNTADYLVSCPVQTMVHQGTSAAAPLLSGTRISYDGGGVGQPPLRCEKTRQDDWTSGGDWITSKWWTYDAFGNLEAEADGAGNTTVTVYDGAYGLYPVETRLPGYASNTRLRTQTGWDMACGQQSTKTDLNGQP